MSAAKNTIPTEQLSQYDDLLASNSSYERKGKTTPYTSVNGHMYSFLSKTGSMGLRLSKDDREDFIAQYNTQLMEQHGRVMQEFAEVPVQLLSQTAELAAWLHKSFEYTTALKPKPTKRK